MKTFLALIFAASIVSACTRSPSDKSSGCLDNRVVPSRLDQVELKAFNDSMSRSMKRCADGITKCEFLLGRGAQIAEISIRVVYTDKNCVGLPGTYPTYLYDSNGDYLGTMTGLDTR